MTRRSLKLGAVIVGVGDGAAGELWRHPDVPTTASIDIDWYVKQAREAEQSHFDFVFIVDSQYIDAGFPHHHLNRLEPFTLLSAVAFATERIGLVATASTTYSEPFDLARRLASLDHISDGRAGWNIVTSQDPGTAGNFSRSEHGDYPTRYRRATESVEVVTALWDSYEDDAFSTDKTADRFLDPDKLHRVDHRGEFYSVTGPLNISRSRQGQPVLIQAGTSNEGRELSAKAGEVIFSFAKDVESALELKRDVRARSEAYGRDPDDLLFVPGLSVLLADSVEEARRLDRELHDAVPVQKSLNQLSRQLGGRDLSGIDLDGPLPELEPGAERGGIASIAALEAGWRADGLTVREILRTLQKHWARFVGTPASVAGEITHWYASGAADGFNLFVHDPETFARLRAEVVPLLVDRGIFRADYETDTLRGHLELAIPANRHTARRVVPV